MTATIPPSGTPVRLTAPLPPAALAALRRLELAFDGRSAADRAAAMAASHVRRTHPAPAYQRRILASFPAGAPRGSWPAEEEAARLRHEGIAAEVRMDLGSDSFLVVVDAGVA